MSRPERDEAARDRPGRLIVVSGLAAEARIAAAPGIVCIVGTGARLHALLERELARGGGAPRDDSPAPDDRAATRDETAANRTTSRCVPALLSFGLAGGLAPALEAGDWIIGSAVVAAGRRWTADISWADSLASRLPRARRGAVAGSEHIVADTASKARMHRDCGALAVDMESHVVAQCAERHGVPFAVLRVVADSADRALPPAACLRLTDRGRVDWGPFMLSLVRTPGQIPALVALAGDARRALRALSSGRRLLGRGPDGADFGQLLVDVP